MRDFRDNFFMMMWIMIAYVCLTFHRLHPEATPPRA
jgi:hypothetical protein